ncbi:RagB/SusD family nutrient uptake outer membrane protein [Arcticibacter tournemirensis]|uniref:RagB/SusD family nutrient uptake outer membrane protein n=1 Tax=Arcticibacter tournemirensis TaxID=699437 RepID=A0A4Q0M6M1_9SPHI|nr:RagB/SusD family nutrient uptake outer membrane protein [Arcticibacter tournemirensis]RXF68635.1 RagB/SusD family nutrient uptake outer membrane protein [Arcticibacter tournemirensis]
MKKILAIIIILFVCSCDKDLLDTTPYSSVSSSNMWSSDNFTDLGVAGVYSALRLGIGNSGNTSPYELYEMDRFGFTGESRGDEPLLTGTTTAGDELYAQIWQYMYEGIQRANDAIVNIPLKSPSSAEKKARYLAECKFLRAYFYFRLNQLYKGVPIYLEPFSPDEATKARSTEEEVWNQILADLSDCVNEPNLPSRYVSGAQNYGHVSKSAVYALRGKVYLYMKKWDLAAADFAQVKAAGHTLFSDYKALFKTANEQCPEMIFSIQNISQSGFGGSTQLYCGSRSSFGSGWNYYFPSPNLVDLYENKDGSKFDWNSVIPGYSSLTEAEREVFFLRDNLTASEIAAATARGAKMSLYLPTGNEQRVRQAYLDRDPRLEANVITPYGTYLGAFNNTATPAIATMRWPYRAQAATGGDLQTDTQNYFYYLYRKFVYEGVSEIVDRNFSPTDFPIIRYGDVLLMWAEALNEQGLVAEATDKVNEVRARAGVALLNSNQATTVQGQADLRERIQNERRVEFPNEGINYFDELRWKTWKEKVFYPGAGKKQVWGTNVSDYSYKGDFLYTWPIPVSEIQMNPNLVQNPGWIN